jgi:hypothetical protein
MASASFVFEMLPEMKRALTLTSALFTERD